MGTPWRELTFVELETDDGLCGVGEVRMVNKTDTLLACLRELGERYVLGSDPFDTELLAQRFQWQEYGRVGEVAQSALAAFDTACWDLKGKALGVPVWRLLGGALRRRVPAYANGWYRTERDPSAVAELAAGVVARGYRALKTNPFGAAVAELTSAELRVAVAIVAAVRERVGDDAQLMVERHGRFVPSAAVRIAHALEEYAPEWLEEPTPPYHAGSLRQVRAHTALPLATGERAHTFADLREIVEEGLADVVQADLTHFGGITGLHKLAGWTAPYDRLLAPHNVCGPVALDREARSYTPDAWIDRLAQRCARYPVVSLEDPLAEDDWSGWRAAYERLERGRQLLGNDLFVTDPDRLARGIAERCANAVLVKPNQTGTVSGTARVVEQARAAKLATVVSARSGESEDHWIADLAVGWGGDQIKIGSTTRSERTAKWNRLLEIESDPHVASSYAGAAGLPGGRAR
ncbi:enolase C-terminal domain-like protein [Streptomyces sp. BK79]|uniref:enolase C-terminal domain-like protein n=1 Tax=Streptomyces sp. BK79 TaxID=3350097 RepID=UPI00376F4E58